MTGIGVLGKGILDGTATAYALGFVGWFFFWLSAFLLIPSLAGGIGLLLQRRWARFLLILVSIELLFVIPVGTVVGVFGLRVLSRRESEQLLTSQPARSAATKQRHNGVLLAMLGVAAGFVVVLGSGFLLANPQTRDQTRTVLLWLAGGLAATVAAWLLSRRRPNSAVPAPARFSHGMSSPDSGSMAVNPGAFATCSHLQPMELAMRMAGITIRRAGASPVQALCRVDAPALRRQFAPPDAVSYVEFFQPERHPEDNPTAMLNCTQCSSRIYVLHPREGRPETPWFPALPPPLA